MRITLIIILGFTTMIVNGQDFIQLNKVNNNDNIIEGQSIIYGNFIQRLGFSSDGFPQDIRIQNIETNEICRFRVKPTFTSKRENIFAFHIKPDTYKIIVYWWTQSKWYGGEIFTEPIYKNINTTQNFKIKLEKGEIRKEDLKQFEFTISENTLNYLGTWHFNTGTVSFSNEKNKIDEMIKFTKINLDNALIILPD